MTLHPTAGAIKAIFNEEAGNPAANAPILQVLNTKMLPSTSGAAANRYRTMFSDGVHVMQGIFATTLNNLIDSGAITKNSLVRVNRYTIKPLAGKKILLVVEVDVLDNVGGTYEKFGDPVHIDPEVHNQPNQGRPAQQSSYQQQQHQQQQRNNPFQQQQNPYQQNAHQPQINQNHQPQIAPSGNPVFPITALNPYQNKWTIMARVTQKSDIRTWSKPGGNEGKLFSMTLTDESGEIKVTGFNQQVDDYFNVVEQDKVYFLSNAKVDFAKKQFSNVKNEYELILQRDSQLIPAPDNAHVPAVRYNFVNLTNLSNLNEKDTVDVIAIIKEVGEFTNNISQKTNKPLLKRDLTLVDASGMSTRLTLWGATAESFNPGSANPVIAFKGVSVSNYGGKSLNAFGGSTFKLNPEINEAFELRGWFDQQGHNTNFQSHTSDFKAGGTAPRMTVDEFTVAAANLNPNEQLNFEVKASIVMMAKAETTFHYPACPTKGCNKKVTEDMNQQWRCEKCNQSFPEPDYRYVMRANIGDQSGTAWVQAFNEAGEVITGKKAYDLVTRPGEVKPTFDQANFKSYIFRCRAKQEVFNDEAKIRYAIIDITPVNWVEESKLLLSKLKEFGI
ncbi:Replication factor A protein 1 [Podila verticillata]|nr:Replication factor A protein 1 [Podila verticillata]